MRKVELGKTGEKISVLGQGTWGIRSFKNGKYYEKWKASIRRGIELGLTHIDTAEIYGRGTSEKMVGSVINEYNRDEIFITSKLFPMHLSYEKMRKAALKSLKRLGISYLDLYLIHWPSPFTSIKKLMRVMQDLVNEGKTRYIGVSNFSVEQFKEAQSFLNVELVNNQLIANVMKQKHIDKSLPYYQKEGVTMTAYSPLGHSGFKGLGGEVRKKLEEVGDSHNATIQQIAIAWLINHKSVITIPKAFKIEHISENFKATKIKLSEREINSLYETQNVTRDVELVSSIS